MLPSSAFAWPRLRAACALAYHLPDLGLHLILGGDDTPIGGISEGPNALHPAELRALVGHAIADDSMAPVLDGLGLSPQASIAITWSRSTVLLPGTGELVVRASRPQSDVAHWVFVTDVWWERSLPLLVEHKRPEHASQEFVDSLLQTLRSIDVWSLFDDVLGLTLVSVRGPASDQARLEPTVIELARRLEAHQIGAGALYP